MDCSGLQHFKDFLLDSVGVSMSEGDRLYPCSRNLRYKMVQVHCIEFALRLNKVEQC